MELIDTEYKFTQEFAASMDAQDPLASFRDEFDFPVIEGKRCLYFTGNSLGLKPKAANCLAT